MSTRATRLRSGALKEAGILYSDTGPHRIGVRALTGHQLRQPPDRVSADLRTKDPPTVERQGVVSTPRQVVVSDSRLAPRAARRRLPTSTCRQPTDIISSF
ncbi:hypothetical protein, partial [Actinomadura macra]|uniref:hypothetical protein n=1 Tax=Actinomadura macra TaxID=46164 RepID=UPI001C3F3529